MERFYGTIKSFQKEILGKDRFFMDGCHSQNVIQDLFYLLGFIKELFGPSAALHSHGFSHFLRRRQAADSIQPRLGIVPIHYKTGLSVQDDLGDAAGISPDDRYG